MERESKEGEMEKKKRRGFMFGNNNSTRASPSTPPPTWRLSDVVETKEFLTSSEASVRKLCAELWETEQFRHRIELRRGPIGDSASSNPFLDHQPPSRGSLRRLSTHHRDGEMLQSVSPASCSSSSLEVVVRKPAFSQTASSVLKSASYGLGSSTKLLKVLNRIWSLEEQNTANMSLVKSLKMELDECRAEIKQVQQRENQSKKKGEEDVFWLMKKELDEERRVRKQSESLHRKLTRDLCEAKHCLTKAFKDLEIERRERVVAENLCDEFARAVKDFEGKLRRRNGNNKSPVSDKVVVQIAEVWNDQRLQMKLKESDKRPDDSASMHQMVCLKELERRTRRDNKLRVVRDSYSSEGDKVYPEISPRNVDDHWRLEKSRTFAKIVPRNANVMVREESHSLKDKLMEARVESRRIRSLRPESSSSHSLHS